MRVFTSRWPRNDSRASSSAVELIHKIHNAAYWSIWRFVRSSPSRSSAGGAGGPGGTGPGTADLHTGGAIPVQTGQPANPGAGAFAPVAAGAGGQVLVRHRRPGKQRARWFLHYLQPVVVRTRAV